MQVLTSNKADPETPGEVRPLSLPEEPAPYVQPVTPRLLEALHAIHSAVRDAEKALSAVHSTLLKVKEKQSDLELRFLGEERHTPSPFSSVHCNQRDTSGQPKVAPTATKIHRTRSLAYGLSRLDPTRLLKCNDDLSVKAKQDIPLNDQIEHSSATGRREEAVNDQTDADSPATATQEALPNDEAIHRIRSESTSRRDFAVTVVRQLFNVDERRRSNTRGLKGKDRLDTARLDHVKTVTLQEFPLQSEP